MNDPQENFLRNTPLHRVTDAQSALALIAQGASLSARNADGETPLLAIELDEGEFRQDPHKVGERVLGLIEVMLAHGADIHAQSPDGTLLHKVAVYFYKEMTLPEGGDKVFEKLIKRLVELGADVNQRNDVGNTPLHYAQHKKWGDCCSKYLLECGADINAQNDDGWTPLMCSIEIGALPEQTQFLIDAGADLSLHDQDGWTALHHAAACDDAEAARLLRAKGARADTLDFEGQTALQLAQARERHRVLDYLKSDNLTVLPESIALSGELVGIDDDRHKRAELRERISAFRDEVNQTEAVFRAAAKGERRWRWLMIAGVPVTVLFFGVPGLMWAITILGILIYKKPLAKAIRYETASQMCLVLSGELRRLMDSTENIHQMEGKFEAMLLQRDQLIKMQEGIFEK